MTLENGSDQLAPTDSVSGKPLDNLANQTSQQTSQRYDGAIGVDDYDQQRAMISSLLDGTFDENVRIHAENLAEKLIERQHELDRREAQLNRMSAEIETISRTTRLVTVTAAAVVDEQTPTEQSNTDLNSTADRTNDHEEVQDLSHDSNVLAIRVDKYCQAQRAPYSKLVARMKKYIGEPHSDRKLANRELPASIVDDSVHDDSGLLGPMAMEIAAVDSMHSSISQLTNSATAVRQRGEAVEIMYEQLANVFAEMLRQQSVMRQLAQRVASDTTQIDATPIQSVQKEIDRLTIQLTMVGRDHFLLPVEAVEAA